MPTLSQLIESLPIPFVIFSGMVLVFAAAFVTWMLFEDKKFNDSFDNANSLFKDEN